MNGMPSIFGAIRGHSLYTPPLGADSVVVDLGANRGEFALQMSRRFGGRYYLVEGNPELHDGLRAHTPFLIQETGAADILPEITEYITRCLCKDIRYVPPSKGRGYNAGFCGLDLSVFDAFDRDTLRSLLDTLRQMPQWWREQAFFVNMTFTSPKAVHTFARDRYMFLPHDDPTYREKSKIYHCIFTTDKRRVDLYYLRRYGRSLSQKLRAVEISGVLLIQRLRKRLQIRTRIYRLLGRPPVVE